MVEILTPQIVKILGILSAAFVLGNSAIAEASKFEEESLSPQAQARVSLGKWEREIDVARKAFTPVLQALKLLADKDFRQGVMDEKGQGFDAYEKEKVQEAWAQQKIVVQFLKDLYGAHTDLIKEYATLLDLLKSNSASLEREQGVSAELRHLLQEKTDIIERLEVSLQMPPLPRRQSGDVLIDLEAQSPSINSPLLGDRETPTPCITPLYTKILYASAGAIAGAGLTALGIYLYFKYQS